MSDAAGIAFAVCGDQVGNVEVPPAASSAMIGSKEYFRARVSNFSRWPEIFVNSGQQLF